MTDYVFPAHAGMSRHAYTASPASGGFPRTRGDEPPASNAIGTVSAFSPHTRG